MKARKITGIVLVILQVLAIIGSSINGNGFPTNAAGWFGFLLLGIVGIILLLTCIPKSSN